MFWIVILFIVILSVLVFVHEAGHFFTARRNGMRVDEFGFGFPPRAGGVVKDAQTGKWKFVWGNPKKRYENTVYSINWIPLGGFVKIKGEDGSRKGDTDSFASKSAWARIKVLGAGVAMNFVLAWVLFSFVMMVGFPREVFPGDDAFENARVQVVSLSQAAPAAEAGLALGDVLIGYEGEQGAPQSFQNIEDVQAYILGNKGSEITLLVTRQGEKVRITGTPRAEYPQNEGSFGFGMAHVATVSTPWYQAPWEGLKQVGMLTILILGALGSLAQALFGGGGEILNEVAGPVGIAYITKQVADLGLLHILQFSAILSVNLGILNILPIPALDGGRIFFVLVEWVKGSPVNQKFEGVVHATGFALLILLMVVVTVFDINKLFS